MFTLAIYILKYFISKDTLHLTDAVAVRLLMALLEKEKSNDGRDDAFRPQFM